MTPAQYDAKLIRDRKACEKLKQEIREKGEALKNRISKMDEEAVFNGVNKAVKEKI